MVTKRNIIVRGVAPRDREACGVFRRNVAHCNEPRSLVSAVELFVRVYLLSRVFQQSRLQYICEVGSGHRVFFINNSYEYVTYLYFISCGA